CVFPAGSSARTERFDPDPHARQLVSPRPGPLLRSEPATPPRPELRVSQPQAHLRVSRGDRARTAGGSNVASHRHRPLPLDASEICRPAERYNASAISQGERDEVKVAHRLVCVVPFVLLVDHGAQCPRVHRPRDRQLYVPGGHRGAARGGGGDQDLVEEDRCDRYAPSAGEGAGEGSIRTGGVTASTALAL